jgi:hypothetical protein
MYSKQSNIEDKDQITGTIYQESLTAMKRILDLGEFKIGAANSKDYAFFKREVMDSVYTALRNIFEEMERDDIVELCDECNADLRKGWKPCTCRGSGYISK